MLRKCLIYKEKHDMGPTHTTLPAHAESAAMGIRRAFLGRCQLAWTKMNESCSRGGVGGASGINFHTDFKHIPTLILHFHYTYFNFCTHNCKTQGNYSQAHRHADKNFSPKVRIFT